MEETQIHIIGHNAHSYNVENSSVIGEVPHAAKLQSFLNKHENFTSQIHDLYKLFQISRIDDTEFAKLRQSVLLNIEMASINEELIIDKESKQNQFFVKTIEKSLGQSETILLFLTWLMNLYGVIGTGIHKRFPSISKLYCWHPGELCGEKARHLIQPYLETDLIICESLLAASEGLKGGIPPWKLLYLPHIYPKEIESISQTPEKERIKYRNNYIQRIANENGKDVPIEDDTLLIGYSTRFQRGKNVEFLIGAISELTKQHPNIILLLKGDFNDNWDHASEYTLKLKEAFEQISQASWFLWDKNFTDFPEVFKIYRSIDLCVYLSGAESASNTLVETLSLGVPSIALDATTNPFLFQDMLAFVKTGDLLSGKVPYHLPDFNHLMQVLENYIISKEARNELRENSLKISRKRFSPTSLSSRLDLLVQAAKSYHKHDAHEASIKKSLEKQLADDFLNYNLKL